MAINEACQVWIEQRIQEELETKGEKSLRSIAGEIASEIERIFEAKVKPTTIVSRVQRAASDANASPTATHENDTQNCGDNGDRPYSIAPAVLVEKVDAVVKRGKSIREAAAEVAEEYGKRPESVRKTYAREKERSNYVCTATEAWQFAEIAISQLGRIRQDDPKRVEELRRVANWIVSQEGMENG